MKVLSKLMILGLVIGMADLGWAMMGCQMMAYCKKGTETEGYGGPKIMLFFPKFDELNSEIKKIGYPTYDGSIFLIGGGGYGKPCRNLRIGGFGGGSSLIGDWGFSKKEEKQGRESSLDMGFGGMMVEYFKSTGKWEFGVGGFVGCGDIDIHFNDSNAKDLIRFKDIYFLYGPSCDLQYQINKAVSLGISANYLFLKLNGKWQGTTLLPASSMDMSGPVISINAIFTEKRD